MREQAPAIRIGSSDTRPDHADGDGIVENAVGASPDLVGPGEAGAPTEVGVGLRQQVEDLKLVRDYWYARCMLAEERAEALQARVERLS